MGKDSDKLYVRAAELAAQRKPTPAAGGGIRRLPFTHCGLSLVQWTNPVMTPEGIIFELTHLVPFLRKYKKNPVTGQEMGSKDVLKLNFHRNADGQLACPATGKVFTDSSKLAALRTTGNVYSWEALDTLCLKTKHLHDLLDDSPFKREDVVILQDPADLELMKRRDIHGFFHIRAGLKAQQDAAAAAGGGEAAAGAAGAGSSGGTTNISTAGGGVVRMGDTGRKILQELEEQEKQRRAAAGEGAESTLSGHKRGREEGEEGGGSSTSSSSSSHGQQHVTAYGVKTSGMLAASFTSTGMSVRTKNIAAAETEQDRLQKRWAGVAKMGKKALLQLQTNKGPLNLELHCDLAPRTCDNFLSLCRKGYYNNCSFHRNIRSFMIQGGDPTGTGRGGESAWAKGPTQPAPFKDEFHPRLSHSERGILSMANAGPDSNKSQFFITFKSCPHLDRKHSIFGRVVGGQETLRALEMTPTDKEDRPLEPLRIEAIEIFADPFKDWEAGTADRALEEARAKAAAGGVSGSAVYGSGASIAARVTHSVAAVTVGGRVETPAQAAARQAEDRAQKIARWLPAPVGEDAGGAAASAAAASRKAPAEPVVIGKYLAGGGTAAGGVGGAAGVGAGVRAQTAPSSSSSLLSSAAAAGSSLSAAQLALLMETAGSSSSSSSKKGPGSGGFGSFEGW